VKYFVTIKNIKNKKLFFAGNENLDIYLGGQKRGRCPILNFETFVTHYDNNAENVSEYYKL
jgi:hypothetical protein